MAQQFGHTTAWEQGAVVVNSRRDNDEIETRKNMSSNRETRDGIISLWPNARASHDDVYSIVSGEPFLMNRHSGNTYLVKDTDFVGLTSLNNAFVLEDQSKLNLLSNSDLDNRNWARQKLRQNMVLAGIARNNAPYDSRDATRDHSIFATLVGGMKSVYNTGNKDIVQGDTVYWDIPPVNENGAAPRREPIEGIENDKILPQLLPVRYDEFDDRESVRFALGLNKNVGNDSPNPIDDLSQIDMDSDIPANRVALYLQQVVYYVFLMGSTVAKNNDNVSTEDLYNLLFNKEEDDGKQNTVLNTGTFKLDVKNENNIVSANMLGKSILDTILGGHFHKQQLDTDDITNNVINAGTELLISLKQSYSELNERIVGKAISSARPGEQFDIRIGSYCI